MRRNRSSRPWHLYALGLVAVVLAVLAALEVGPPSSSARTSREVVTAENGVVQSTVTGTGNVEPGTDIDANFRTSGTLQDVYVKVGQHVTQGQLLATLDPTSAQLSVDQAEESLTAAEDQLTAAQDGTATGASSSSSDSTSASYTKPESSTEFVSYTRTRPTRTTTTPTTTTPTRTAPASTSRPGRSRSTSTGSSSRGSTGGSSARSSSGTQTSTTPSPAGIASAQAAVYSAEANVRSAEQALSETKLTAPTSGTIVSMADLVPGDSVSAGSTTSGAASSGSSSSSSSSTVAGSTTAGSLSSSSSSSNGSGSSSSPFVEIVNSGTMTMTVAFSESDISKVHVGEPATITLDALPGVELAAHVSQISDVGSSSSGVVSYNATLTVNQRDSKVKPGMSASAAVIVAQAQGVTVPNAAVTGSGSLGTVNVIQKGKTVSRQVVVGLRGDSRTQIVSGLSAGQQLVVTVTLPSLSTSSTSTGSSGGTLGGAGFRGLGGAGFFGGGGGFFGGAGAFLRRGGG